MACVWATIVVQVFTMSLIELRPADAVIMFGKLCTTFGNPLTLEYQTIVSFGIFIHHPPNHPSTLCSFSLSEMHRA